ncbi:hypothetical protein PG996_009104 [Apiospora saccharicola]|uniref:Uncharacterized protein n=1 Tax=Apiospora saccharicola TaxID=335842 RepID=A0ABR1UJS8_9PEZI
MQLSTFFTLAFAVPAALAAPLADPTPEQSPNTERLFPRQAPTIWVWACDGENFTGKCGEVKTIDLGTCYAWSSLFPGIGNGSFRTNSFALWFYDQAGCSGTQSGRVCNGDAISRGNYW